MTWRGAVEPLETNATGNALRTYRGAVEPQASGDDVRSGTALAGKLDAVTVSGSLDDVDLAGRV